MMVRVTKPPKIKELCLAGAANRGICYIGVLGCLHEHNLLDLDKLYAVSIGSLIGTLYIIGYSPTELMKEIIIQDMSDFQDISIDSVFNNGSVLRGEKYRLWVLGLLSKKIDPMITFKQLYDKTNIFLNISAVSLDSGEDGLEYFNYELTPDMPVYYAILASMTIPLLFPPIFYNNKRYIDGAILENFPMHLLSKDGVGFRVSSKKTEAELSNGSYIMKMIELISTKMRKMIKFEGTSYVVNASDYGGISFVLSKDNKITLYYRGYTKAMECKHDMESKYLNIQKEQENLELLDMSKEDCNILD